MLAKYESTCPFCSAPIRVGDPITWRRGRAALHRDCQAAAWQHAEDDRRLARKAAGDRVAAAFVSAELVDVPAVRGRKLSLADDFLGAVLWVEMAEDGGAAYLFDRRRKNPYDLTDRPPVVRRLAITPALTADLKIIT